MAGVSFLFGAVAGVFPLLVDVATGGESLVAGTGDDYAADIIVGVGLHHRVVELGVHNVVHGVQHLRPIHGDDCHAFFVFHLDRFVSHLPSS